MGRSSFLRSVELFEMVDRCVISDLDKGEKMMISFGIWSVSLIAVRFGFLRKNLFWKERWVKVWASIMRGRRD